MNLNFVLKNQMRERIFALTFTLVMAATLTIYDYFRQLLPTFLEFWAGGLVYVIFWIFLAYTELSIDFRL